MGFSFREITLLIIVWWFFLGILLYLIGPPNSDVAADNKSYSTTTEMIRHLSPNIDVKVADFISKSIEKHKGYFPRELLVSLIFTESGFKPLAESKCGCIGLMQINPKAHPEKVGGFTTEELFYINVNVMIGCKILKEYYEKGNLNIKRALIRYLGTHNTEYIEDIICNTVDLMMFTDTPSL